jgi:large-conductance mechanosensitive channel
MVTAIQGPIKAQQVPPAADTGKAVNKAVNVDWTVAGYPVGHFVGELINFVIIAFAISIRIVQLLGGGVKRVGGTPKPGEPTAKERTECLSIVPIKARRCSHCTAVQEPPSPAAVAALGATGGV